MYLVDNIEHEKQVVTKDGPKDVDGYEVKTSFVQTDKNVTLTVDYKSKNKKELYVAFSILRDGFSFAELTTPDDMRLKGTGRVQYTLDTTLLNGGVYEIPVILCERDARKLVSVSKDKNRFVIKGSDTTKGGAMKLDHNWKQV